MGNHKVVFFVGVRKMSIMLGWIQRGQYACDGMNVVDSSNDWGW